MFHCLSWGNKGRAGVGCWVAPDLLYACSGFVEMLEDASQCRDFPLRVTRWCLHCPLLFQPPFCHCIVFAVQWWWGEVCSYLWVKFSLVILCALGVNNQHCWSSSSLQVCGAQWARITQWFRMEGTFKDHLVLPLLQSAERPRPSKNNVSSAWAT